MGGDPELRVLGCNHDQTRQGVDQIRMQAGFRFVQSEQGWRPGTEQSRGQAQKSKLAVREFPRLKRTQQAGNLQTHLELGLLRLNQQRGAAEGLMNRILQRFFISDFENGLESGSQIGPIVTENRRLNTNLRLSQRRFGIGTEVVVEAPPKDFG